MLDENQAAQAAGQERPHNSSAVHELQHFELTERVGRRIAGARVPFEHSKAVNAISHRQFASSFSERRVVGSLRIYIQS